MILSDEKDEPDASPDIASCRGSCSLADRAVKRRGLAVGLAEYFMHRTIILFCFTLLLSGCVGVAKFPGIEPVSFRPSGVAPHKAVEVSTLHPSFSWKALPGGVSYDFAIWSVGRDGGPGETVYFVEKIDETEHTPPQGLLPGEYFWSVKPHGSTVWATTSFTQVNPLWVSWGRGLPFKIKVVAK